jgi:hypothetical protein
MSLQVPMRRGRSLDFGAIKWVPDNPSRCKTKKLYGARELTNGGFRLSNANSCLSGLSNHSAVTAPDERMPAYRDRLPKRDCRQHHRHPRRQRQAREVARPMLVALDAGSHIMPRCEQHWHKAFALVSVCKVS